MRLYGARGDIGDDMDTNTMSAATILVTKHGHAENIKEEALRLSEMYDGNIQIQIDVKRKDGVAIMRVTEYNL